MFSIVNRQHADIARDIAASASIVFAPPAEERVSDDLLSLIGEPDPELHAALPTIDQLTAMRFGSRTFADLPPLCPEEDDPSILFRHNWLARGQSAMLVASSGVGKSSMAVQMGYNWAVGVSFLATPMRPLKIAIIQGEDSDRDLQEQRFGMRRGFEAAGWTPEQIAEAEARIEIPTGFVGTAGDSFIERLAEYQRLNRFDLIIINPVQSFFGGDVSSQEDVSHFCREGLDPIMKDDEAGCAILCVAHTPKQKSGTKDGRQNVDDYGEYLMAGSHEWTDWARAVFCFLKSEKFEGVFDFAAAKRGRRLGWTDADGQPTIKKRFSHSDGFIFWRELDPSDPLLEEAEEPPRGRRERPALDVRAAASYWAKEIAERLCGMPATAVREAIYDGFKREGRTRDDARIVFDEIAANAEAYGLTVIRGDGRHSFTFGTEE